MRLRGLTSLLRALESPEDGEEVLEFLEASDEQARALEALLPAPSLVSTRYRLALARGVKYRNEEVH